MKLFYFPGACSLAPHIVAHEAGLAIHLAQVEMPQKMVEGQSFLTINPKGYVPALQLDDGQVLSEVSAVMHYLATQAPQKRLVPEYNSIEYFRLLEWLNYIATELHKGFGPLWIKDTPESVKESARQGLMQRFGWINQQLSQGPFLLGESYSIADAYLFTIAGWSAWQKLSLAEFPNLTKYLERIQNRPATIAAMRAEGLLK